MKDKSCLVEQKLVVEVTGVSTKSKEDAVNQAFTNLRPEVAKQINHMVIYMRPVDVEIKDLTSQEYTERFLFIFMPRKKEKVRITLRVTVEVSSLNI